MLNWKKQWWIVVLYVAIAATVVSAEEQTLKLTLKQAEGNKEIKDVLINIIVTDQESSKERIISSFIRNNPITLRLEQGSYLLKFQIDDLKTPGKDYYVEQEIVLDKSHDQEIIAFPVGSLKGVVYDSLNNLVSKAKLKVECSKDYGSEFPESTDLVGSFSIPYAPIDECSITATADDSVGSGKISIAQGNSQNIEIRLNRTVISEGNNGWLIFLSILLACVIGVAGWFGWKYWPRREIRSSQEVHEKEKTSVKQQEPEQKLNKRIQDILSTLNEKENAIVTFLLNNNHQSTQAKVRYETGIPKTTLVRIFTSLQNKKIITIETVGKLKKIKLTNWFLDKEK